MKAFKGLWVGAGEMGSVEICFDISLRVCTHTSAQAHIHTHTHTHTHLPAAKARRPFPAVRGFVGISHSGVERLLEGSGSGDGVAVIQREGQLTSL